MRLLSQIKAFFKSSDKPSHIESSADIVPYRSARIVANFGSERERRLRSLFEQDGYQSPSIEIKYLTNCVLDTSSGLVVLNDGRLDDWARHIASYYVDTTLGNLPRRVQNAVTSTVPDRVIHVFHRSCSAYGHFVLDGLCAIALLSDQIRREGLKILVPDFLPAWATNALADVGFDESKILLAQGTVRFRHMALPSTVKATSCFLPSPTSMDALRKLAKPPHQVDHSRRIYLSREGAYSPRTAKNETDVIALFVDAGFEIISPASLSFREQINLFASTGIIAGNHGSAFANMVFTPPGAQIIDLMPEHWIGYWIDGVTPERWLFNLTAACSHDYSVILSPSTMDGDPYIPNVSTKLAKIEAETDLDAIRTVLADLS
ncbi:glycosyltransferase 61 family protein [Aminobacter sp. P9b]|uniref:glycosyltransferase family 61 protein n=1 Tax=Aminobacter sp. P9b TaxID=3133697 RepID=UPI00324393B2